MNVPTEEELLTREQERRAAAKRGADWFYSLPLLRRSDIWDKVCDSYSEVWEGSLGEVRDHQDALRTVLADLFTDRDEVEWAARRIYVADGGELPIMESHFQVHRDRYVALAKVALRIGA